MSSTKTATRLCSGVCNGEITLTTDGQTLAYAVVVPDFDTGLYEQDCPLIERRDDGTIVVSCAAVNGESDIACDGTAHFAPDDLDDTPDAPSAHLMHRMDGAL